MYFRTRTFKAESHKSNSWKGHESGQAVFIFPAATPLLRPARKNRHATQAII